MDGRVVTASEPVREAETRGETMTGSDPRPEVIREMHVKAVAK